MLQALKSGFRSATVYILVFGISSIALYFAVLNTVTNAYAPIKVDHQWNLTLLKLLNLGLCLITAVILFLATVQDNIIKKQNFVPITLFILLQPLLLNQRGFDFNILHQVLLILALRLVFNTYRKDKQERRLFDAAFFLGLDFVIMQKGMGLLFIFLIILNQLRTFKISEWMAVVFGYTMPLVIYVITIWLIQEQMILFKFFKWSFFWPQHIDFNAPLVFTQFIFLCISFLAFGFIFKSKSGIYAKQHTFHQAIMLLLIWSSVQCFNSPNSPFNWLAYNVIWVCFCVGEYIAFSKREAIWNAALYFIIMCIYAETLQDRLHWF